MTIKETLLKLGVTPNLKGFYYVDNCTQRAIKCIENKRDISFMQLYTDCANDFNVTTASVERCIRHTVDVAKKADSLLFGIMFEGIKNISCGLFIAMIAEHVMEDDGDD